MKGKKWVIAYSLTIAAVLALSAWGSRTVTVLAENQSIDRKHCIVIDAGHGGEDGGATSCTGLLESTYNLTIAQRLNDLLRLLGYDTKMIRTSDGAVSTEGETIARRKASDLRKRVRTVNETENALLLSIHQNNFTDSRYSGPLVFWANTEGSEDLAKLLQSQLTAVLAPGNRRSARRMQGVYLMEHINTTGVLIECGFLSNPAEEAKLRDPGYQKKLCAVIAASVSQFLSNT